MTHDHHQHAEHHQHAAKHERHEQEESRRIETESWDARYSESEQIWSGNPNTVLVDAVTPLAPGRALDLGCGEGADAVWLAAQGWQVRAVDISRVALARAERHARDAGAARGDAELAGRIDWQWHDLAVTFPEGAFDLVSAQFLHTAGEMPRDLILRQAMESVSPGGVLLVVGHSGFPEGHTPPQHGEGHGGHGPDHPELPTTEEVLASLELERGPGVWEVLRAEDFDRTQVLADGREEPRTDSVVLVRRLR